MSYYYSNKQESNGEKYRTGGLTYVPAQQSQQQPQPAELQGQERQQQPSIQRHPLPKRQPQPNSHVFNVPKPGQSRPEHHRPKPPSTNLQHSQAAVPNSGAPRQQQPSLKGAEALAAALARGKFVNPRDYLTEQPIRRPSPDVVEIPKPAAPQTYTTPAAPQQLFSSLPGGGGGFKTVNDVWREWDMKKLKETQVEKKGHGGDDDDDPDGFDVNGALREPVAFGAPDPYAYVDAGKATENIKALLEGAFDEGDDEKPKTRRTRRQPKKVTAKESDELADKLGALDIKSNGEDDADTKAGMEEEEEVEDDSVVEGLKVRLLPHQVEGVDWMLDREIGSRKKNGVLPHGGILADDMGLGKTIQAVALILINPRPSKEAEKEHKKEKKENKRRISSKVGKGTLVVAPLALIKQWEAEIKDKVERSHQLRVLVHHGPSRTKRGADLGKYDVVITTYQVLASEHAGCSGSPTDIEVGKIGCFGVRWYRVIADEAHTIKNRNAKMTQACYALDSHYRWCLTGTPMQNNLDELQSLIHFLRIKPYNNITTWKNEITNLMKNGRGALAMKRLQWFLKAFMKRRTKDVLKKDGALTAGGVGAANGGAVDFKIVERKVENVVVDFTPYERDFYDKLSMKAKLRLDEMMDKEKTDYIGALVLVLRLRQACNHPRLVASSFSKDKDIYENSAENRELFLNGDKHKSSANDMDDIAHMFGGLNVGSKQCEVCQINLSIQETKAGKLHCEDCNANLKTLWKHKGKSTPRKKNGQKDKHRAARDSDVQRLRNARRRRHVVDDSDDEEGEGDWVVNKEDRRSSKDLGVAGDTDDENAEGGGRWLKSDEEDMTGSEDSENEDDEEEDSVEDIDTNDPPPDCMYSTKIRELLKILKRECPKHKVIVFSQFTSMLDIVEPFVEDKGYKFVRYDGSMPNNAREASLHQLRTDKKTRVLLCSLKCGSLGLNLTAASRVVILEPFWNPFVEEQAIDRVHRLNQTVDVVVYKITIADTVEERILDLQEAKRALANAAIEGTKALNKLSMADIMRLFRRDAEGDPEHGQAGPGHTQPLDPRRNAGWQSSQVRQPITAVPTSHAPHRGGGGAGTKPNPYTEQSFWNQTARVGPAASQHRVPSNQVLSDGLTNLSSFGALSGGKATAPSSGVAKLVRQEDAVYGRR